MICHIISSYNIALSMELFNTSFIIKVFVEVFLLSLMTVV